MIAQRNPEEIECIRRSGRIVAEVFRLLQRKIRPGITTAELDELAEREVRKRGGSPAFKGYKGYPASLCVSVNDEVVHGIPGPRVLKSGDIISFDLGVEFGGYFGDAAITVAVGRLERRLRRLIKVTREALFQGIARARPGARLSDISFAIQRYVEKNGFSVVRDLVGHGIGKELHEEPQIPNFGPAGQGPELAPGMVLAIEPMVNLGGFAVETRADGWTVGTKDRLPSAHFEHTVVVGRKRAEILTR